MACYVAIGANCLATKQETEGRENHGDTKTHTSRTRRAGNPAPRRRGCDLGHAYRKLRPHVSGNGRPQGRIQSGHLLVATFGLEESDIDSKPECDLPDALFQHKDSRPSGA